MKLVFSEYIEEIFLHANAYNVLHFQNSLHVNYCLNAFREYVKLDKDIDVQDFVIEKSNGKKLSEKTILYIPWNYSSFENDVNIQKIIMNKMSESLEHQEELFVTFQRLNKQMFDLFAELEASVKFENYKVNFDIEKVSMFNMLKLVKTSFVSEKTRFALSLFEEKNAYLKFMLQHNPFQLVIVEMPETMMNIAEKMQFLQELQELAKQVTVLVITNSIDFIPAQDYLQSTNIINFFGKKQQLDKIVREGLMFTNDPETLYRRVMQKLLQEHQSDIFIPESMLLDKIIQNKF